MRKTTRNERAEFTDPESASDLILTPKCVPCVPQRNVLQTTMLGESLENDIAACLVCCSLRRVAGTADHSTDFEFVGGSSVRIVERCC